MTIQIALTLIMMVVIVVLLLKGTTSPGVIFSFVPIVFALLMGFGLKDINGFIGNGLKTVSGTLFLMVFAVLYFGILHEAGVFKALVSFVLRYLGNSVLGTLIASGAISMLTQLDGSGATTALCTIPTMRPIFERQKIRREALLLIESLASGILCLLPWAPAIVEASAYVELDVVGVFRFLLPVFIFGIVMVFVFCVPVAIIEKKHGAGLSDEEFKLMKQELNTKLEFPLGKGVAIFDGVFTLILMAALLAGWVSTNVAFGVGYGLLLVVNFPKVKKQQEYFKQQAPVALSMAFTMLGVGVLVGINNGTGALNDLAVLISEHAPHALLAHLPVIVAALALLLTITMGSAKNAIIIPALIPIVAPFGFTPIQVMAPIFTAGVIGANLCLFNASPYLALGLAEVEMKDHLKYSLLPVYGYSLLMVLFMVITGMLPL